MIFLPPGVVFLPPGVVFFLVTSIPHFFSHPPFVANIIGGVWFGPQEVVKPEHDVTLWHFPFRAYHLVTDGDPALQAPPDGFTVHS